MKYLSVFIAGIMISLCTHASSAIPGFWKDSAYAIECQETTVNDLLNDFAESFGTKLVVTGTIIGNCNGWKRADNAIEFLDNIAHENGLHWFFYKNKLYFSSTNDYETKRIKATPDFKNALKGLGLFQEKFGWGEIEEEGAVIISGPSKYVEFVSKLGAKKKSKRKSNKNGDIYVFQLKFASVADRKVKIRDEEVVIPGVASILKNLLEDKESVYREEINNADGERIIKNRKDKTKVYVEGDIRTNSVIIRAKEKDYDFYHRLISDLDISSNLVEIDAIIVDITREKLKEIGVNFKYSGSDGKYQLNTLVNGLASNTINTNATILIKDLDKFYIGLKALEGSGDASIVANTSILTMENQPAVIDLSETVFLRSLGERVVDVRPITAGTLLNVTPRKIATDDGDKIKLLIDIEDGKLIARESSSDSTPAVVKTTISTRALIDQNRSLVIGGYHLQQWQNDTSGIPLLKDIPAVGKLFSSKIEKSSHIERLFILTPRVSMHHNNPADYSTTGNGELVANAVERIQERWANANRNYVEKVEALLSALASKKIPKGYRLDTVNNKEAMGFNCLQPGIEFKFKGGQKITGKGLKVYIGVAVNHSDQPITVAENHCGGRGLIAVTLFPEHTINPGEATEIFVSMESARIENNNRQALVANQ